MNYVFLHATRRVISVQLLGAAWDEQ